MAPSFELAPTQSRCQLSRASQGDHSAADRGVGAQNGRAPQAGVKRTCDGRQSAAGWPHAAPAGGRYSVSFGYRRSRCALFDAM